MMPKSLREAQKNLATDERGVVRGIRVSHNTVTGPLHCLSQWGEQMVTEAGAWVRYAERLSYGDVAYYRYDHALSVDPVVTGLPAIGTQVWQITPTGVLRTSRIARYAGVCIGDGPRSIQAILEAVGPQAGVPVAGDSGSVCWVRVAHLDGGGAAWMVLGMASYAGLCTVAMPAVPPVWSARRLWVPVGADLGQPDRWVGRVESDLWRMVGDEEQAAEIVLPDAGAQDAVGQSTAGPDGVPDVLLQVESAYKLEDISSIEVTNDKGDKWAWPKNDRNWMIWSHQLPNDGLLLRINKSQESEDYRVVITSKAGAASSLGKIRPVSLLPDPKPEQPKPEAPPTPPVQAPSVEALQDRIDELVAQNSKLEERIAVLVKEWNDIHDVNTSFRAENAGLRDTLAAERSEAAALRGPLEMLGKAMGWAK